MPTPSALLAVLVSYLLGAVPFGLVLVRLVRGVDIRTVGSGNIGATNAMRAGGKPLGLFVFFLDVAKGWAPAAVIAPWFVNASDGSPGVLQVACGAAAVLGHCFPAFLAFRGGKGVATGCGALIALEPTVFLVGGAVWVLTLLAFRFVGLASMAMGVAFLIAALWLAPERREIAVGAGLLALLILLRHRSNITAMLNGTEPKVLQGRSAKREVPE